MLILKRHGRKVANRPSDVVSLQCEQWKTPGPHPCLPQGEGVNTPTNNGQNNSLPSLAEGQGEGLLYSILDSQFEHVKADKLEPVSLAGYVNDSLTNLFQPRYFSPRPERTTLQIPVQGIGEWCHPKATFELNDSALRVAETLETSVGVPFLTPVKGHNVVFTTLWDNFPSVNTIPLQGKANRIYLMMAGSTNAMQSQIENGVVRVAYTDGSADSLLLINPESWIPIEQDFYDDGLAFRLKAKRPYRLHLKTGLVSRTLSAELGRDAQDAAHSVDLNSTGIFGNVLEGGAATLYDLPLDDKKELKHLQVEALSNDVVIGLLGVTLQR